MLQRLVSDECAEIQRDEMLALKCIFEEDLSLVEEDSKCFKISLMETDKLQDEDEQVDVWFRWVKSSLKWYNGSGKLQILN